VIGGDGSEKLIQFNASGWDDFELRSKDQAVFIYENSKLVVVHNLTIGIQYRVGNPGEAATWLTIAVVAVVVVILAIIGIQHAIH
jgi:hypothetical protein